MKAAHSVLLFYAYYFYVSLLLFLQGSICRGKTVDMESLRRINEKVPVRYRMRPVLISKH